MQGHDEPELVAALRDHLLEDAGQLSGCALCDVLWSLAVLDQLSPDAFRRMCARLEQLPLGAFEPEVYSAASPCFRSTKNCLSRRNY